MSAETLRGDAAAPGRGIGRAWAPRPGRRVELERVHRATAAAQAELSATRARWRDAGPAHAIELLGVHELLAADPALLLGIAAHVEAGLRAEAALDASAAALTRAHLPGRGAPAEEAAAVLQRMRRHLPAASAPARPPGPVVLVGDPPDIADVLALHEDGCLAAIAAPGGGADSHLGLLARELGVPAVMGAGPALWDLAAGGARIIVDGDRGEVLRPSGPALPRTTALPSPSAPVPGFAVRAALSSPAGLAAAIAAAAEGIGLLRSDCLWGAREDALDASLLRVAGGAGPGGLTIRAYDRPAAGLPRGPALLAAEPEATMALLRAACRAQAGGPVRVLLPCIVHAGQIAPWRAALDRAACSVGHSPPPLGVMVETPAAALAPAAVLASADFGVIGTGDLCCLLGGTDREALGAAEREAVAPVLHELLAGISGAARAAGRAVEVAGPAARQPALVRDLRDLGFAGVSVAPTDVAPVRDALRAPRA